MLTQHIKRISENNLKYPITVAVGATDVHECLDPIHAAVSTQVRVYVVGSVQQFRAHVAGADDDTRCCRLRVYLLGHRSVAQERMHEI